MGGEMCKYHVPFTTRAARDNIDILKKKLSNRAWLISIAPNIVYELDWQKSKETVQLFWAKFNVLDCSSLCFFNLKHGLSYEAGGSNLLYKKDLKRNKKDYFKLVEGLSYRGFRLLRVKLQQMYEGNPGEIDFVSSYHEVQVAGEGQN